MVVHDSEKRPTFKKLVIEEFMKFENLNFFLQRKKAYNPVGRLQTEEQAKEKDTEVLKLLEEVHKEYGIEYQKTVGTPEGAEEIVKQVLKKI